MVGVPWAHSWSRWRVQGSELEPASGGSRGPSNELEITAAAVRALRMGEPEQCREGAVIRGVGGVPDLQHSGVPPVRLTD